MCTENLSKPHSYCTKMNGKGRSQAREGISGNAYPQILEIDKEAHFFSYLFNRNTSQNPSTQNPHWKSIAALTPFDIKYFLDSCS